MELLCMAHRGIPPVHQGGRYPGATGCPVFVQFREIIRTLPGFETQFPFGGVRALDRAGPLSPLERVKGSRAKKLVYARPKEADRRHWA